MRNFCSVQKNPNKFSIKQLNVFLKAVSLQIWTLFCDSDLINRISHTSWALGQSTHTKKLAMETPVAPFFLWHFVGSVISPEQHHRRHHYNRKTETLKSQALNE